MNWRNTKDNWGRGARLLHWLMALLIFAQYALGWIADRMDRSPLRVDMMTAHKSLGITLLILLILRLAWRFGNSPPEPLGSPSPRELLLVRLGHGALYVLILSTAMSGWLAASTAALPWSYWWLFPWPALAATDEALHRLAENLHALSFWGLLILIAGHVAAALHHHFRRGNRTLLRMWKISLLTLVLAAPATSAGRSDTVVWTADPASSRLSFQARYEGTALDGVFETFKVTVITSGDGRRPVSLAVRVETGSADMQDSEVNQALREPDWFDIAAFPVSEFESSDVSASDSPGHVARGRLQLKQFHEELAVPFDWTLTGESAMLTGELALSRLAWGVGAGEWSDTGTIADRVLLSFRIVMKRDD